MELSALLAFATIFAVACASPGPSTAAVVARVLATGAGSAPVFCGGLLLGDLLWLACAGLGLAGLVAVFQPVLAIIKYLGAAYLLYLAWRMWTAPVILPTHPATAKSASMAPFLGGLALALGNPKTMLFYLALLPSVVQISTLTWTGFMELAGVVTVVYSAVLAAYVLAAARMRLAFRSPRAMRIVNRTTGTVMAGAAVAVVTRD